MMDRRARRPWWGICAVLLGLGAAPTATSYQPIDQAIEKTEKGLEKPGGGASPHAPGWNAFLGEVRSTLRDYATAQTENDRLRALSRLYTMSVAVRGISWQPVVEVREELRTWLRPRVRLAWAERRLVDRVLLLPTSPGEVKRTGWETFVNDQLGAALRSYESASTVAQHRAALKKVYASLNALRSTNESHPWSLSSDLESALSDLFNGRNLDLTADAAALAPVINQNLVTDGPVFFRGQWSYVTAGPKIGFGLLASDDGVGFFNSQRLTSTTNIQGFNEQMERDPRGRKATKLYHFDASSVDGSQLTMNAVIRTDGLHLWPSYQHNVAATIGSAPTEGNGLGRGIASLIGMNQPKITQKVAQGAIGQIAQGVESGAMELGTIRANEAAAQQNVKLRQYLVGNDTLVYKNLAINRLSLRSRPDHALVGGTVLWKGADEQLGAESPQPASLRTFEPGIAGDIHLPSIMTNLTRGYLQSPAAKDVENLMIVTRQVPPGAPPSEGIVASRNVSFDEFREAIATARAAKDPKVAAIRIKKPGRAPEFAADSRGFLVALVHDFAIEVPAPPQAAQGSALAGPPADIYMLSAPEAEFVISFKIDPAQGETPVRLSGRIEEFDPGRGARVYAVTNDESKATPLTSFTSAVVFRLFAAKLHGQPIDIPLSNIQLKGLELSSVSPLHPSGWLRFVLTPTSSHPRMAQEVGPHQPPTIRIAERP
ncbi:MAG TPA: hypothetical protein VGZ22_30205 [Isosphaeraceae bacterium]|jgi:hypothetical protein|nr:hypothetical protein [Isosphaeraceae bacterium]